MAPRLTFAGQKLRRIAQERLAVAAYPGAPQAGRQGAGKSWGAEAAGIGLQNQKAPQMIVCGPCFGNNDHIFGSFQS